MNGRRAWVVALGLVGCTDAPIQRYGVDAAFGALDCDVPFDSACTIDNPVELVALQQSPRATGDVVVLGANGEAQIVIGAGGAVSYGPPTELGGSNRVSTRLLVCDDASGDLLVVRSPLDRFVEPTLGAVDGDAIDGAQNLDKFELAGARCLRGAAPSVLVGLAEVDRAWVGTLFAPGTPIAFAAPEQPYLEFMMFDARATDLGPAAAVLVRVAFGGTQVDGARIALEGDSPSVLDTAQLFAPTAVFAVAALDADAAMRFAFSLKDPDGWSLALVTVPAGGGSPVWDTMELDGEPLSLRAADITEDGIDELVVAAGYAGVLVLGVDDDMLTLIAAFDIDANTALAANLDGGPVDVLSIAPHQPGVSVQWNAL